MHFPLSQLHISILFVQSNYRFKLSVLRMKIDLFTEVFSTLIDSIEQCFSLSSRLETLVEIYRSLTNGIKIFYLYVIRSVLCFSIYVHYLM